MKIIKSICEDITQYLLKVQDFRPGEYYGSFWSEKAYHGPLLDYHAGGSHHNRGAGSAALGLWLVGKQNNDSDLTRRAETAFDWLAARQHRRGGYFEIQNNEKPSDWEHTGLEELSTIETAFVVHGLGMALLQGLPPKKNYLDCLKKAGLWFLSIELPPGSGVFPHHERSPYDTLNATFHSVESLALIYWTLKEIYNNRIGIFLQGACRGIRHTLPLQWKNGCYPYGAHGDSNIKYEDSTINYTSLVLWCLLNTLDVLPASFRSQIPAWRGFERKIAAGAKKAGSFLCNCVDRNGALLWEKNETSTAKYNIWTYAITFNVLMRTGGSGNIATAKRILRFLANKRTSSGLLPMRDRGEEITECAYMQSDILLFFQPFINFNI
ncbi:MAG: hypothetical protein KJ964_00825 [Verrucomicrobia bacterium]|nr:hypothetical protein [Verrucomicrobiota bacterium]MBU1734841.1 hypothetical protein [Verrucomicrobiota bacterium]MBU1855921.1 hypothetical protein [Verrucomicrobiota bacterium]